MPQPKHNNDDHNHNPRPRENQRPSEASAIAESLGNAIKNLTVELGQWRLLLKTGLVTREDLNAMEHRLVITFRGDSEIVTLTKLLTASTDTLASAVAKNKLN